MEPAVHGGPAGRSCGSQNDGQQRGDVGGTQAHRGSRGRELLLPGEWEIAEGVGIVIELAKFVRAPAGAFAGFVTRRSAAALRQGGFDLVSVVIRGLSRTARAAGLPGCSPKNTGDNCRAVANPSRDR